VICSVSDTRRSAIFVILDTISKPVAASTLFFRQDFPAIAYFLGFILDRLLL